MLYLVVRREIEVVIFIIHFLCILMLLFLLWVCSREDAQKKMVNDF